MLPETFLMIEAILLGLVFGSFLNACIYRIPRGLTLWGRSQCPQCQHTIRWFENVPVLSYLLQGGRCRHCKTGISFQYPFVEILTTLLSVATLIHANYSFGSYILWFLFFICPLVAITFIDFEHQIIPDVISLPGIILGILVTLFHMWPFVKEALIFSGTGLVIGGGTLLLLAYLYMWIRKREGMGGGDIKLCAMLGAFLGWKGVVFVFFISSLLAILYAVVSLIFSRRESEEEGPQVIPYGPFLSAGAIIYYFFGSEIVSFYFHSIGLQDIYF